jgi:predicted esterase
MVPWTQDLQPTWFDMSMIYPGSAEFMGADGNVMQDVADQIWDTVLEAAGDYIDPHDVAIVGFGQGAVMALLLAMGMQRGLAGVASLHGWIPSIIQEVCNIFYNTAYGDVDCGYLQRLFAMQVVLPIFWGHGTNDQTVPVGHAWHAVRFLRHSLRIPDSSLTLRRYTGLGHDVNIHELTDLYNWLLSVLISVHPHVNGFHA